MKKNMIWIALAALILPALARGLWFYRGIPQRPEIAIPDYPSFTIAQPPLSTPVAAGNVKAETMGGVVLFDKAHFNQYQSAEMQSLQDEIARRGGQTETISDASLLEHKLKYASAFVVISPSVTFTDNELRIIQNYIERGGRLLVFTDATRGIITYDWNTGAQLTYTDSAVVNPLLSPFGITVNDDYLYDVEKHEGNFRNVYFDAFGKDELTFGLKRVAFYGTHSVESALGLTLLRGAESTLSSVGDLYDPASGGAAISEDGNVLALGDFTFLSPPYNSVEDNAALIANIADFALGSERLITLANFPYLFTQKTVQVYPTSEIELSAETIAALGGIQQALGSVGIRVEVVDKTPRGGDTLVLGTFTPSDDLEIFTEPFGIEASEDEETILVKKFGKIGRSGNGLLLFEQGKSGNTLTLLADTQEDLLSLVATIGSGSLSSCIVQDRLAVCSIGSGGDYSSSEETATAEPASGEATPEASATATPEPTATPSG
jgi:hypothetical protein